MKVVIDITDEDYYNLMGQTMTIDEMYNTLDGRIKTAIVRGTIIPEGHNTFQNNVSQNVEIVPLQYTERNV